MLLPPRRKKGAIEGRAGPQPATGTRTNCFWYQKHWPLGSIGYEIMGTSKKIHGFFVWRWRSQADQFQESFAWKPLDKKVTWTILRNVKPPDSITLWVRKKVRQTMTDTPNIIDWSCPCPKILRPGVPMQSSKWQWKIPYQYVYIYIYI